RRASSISRAGRRPLAGTGPPRSVAGTPGLTNHGASDPAWPVAQPVRTVAPMTTAHTAPSDVDARGIARSIIGAEPRAPSHEIQHEENASQGQQDDGRRVDSHTLSFLQQNTYGLTICPKNTRTN